MNDKPICACRVKYLGKNGTDYDKTFADKRLKVGNIYEVYRIYIENWKTRLYLRGIPDDFNSVMFEPVDWIN